MAKKRKAAAKRPARSKSKSKKGKILGKGVFALVHPRHPDIEAILQHEAMARENGFRIAKVFLSQSVLETLERTPALAQKLKHLPLSPNQAGAIKRPHVAIVALSDQQQLGVDPAIAIRRLPMRADLGAEDSFAALRKETAKFKFEIKEIELPKELYGLICNSPRVSGSSFGLSARTHGEMSINFDGHRVTIAYRS